MEKGPPRALHLLWPRLVGPQVPRAHKGTTLGTGIAVGQACGRWFAEGHGCRESGCQERASWDVTGYPPPGHKTENRGARHRRGEMSEQLKIRGKRGKDPAHWDREKGGAVNGEVGGTDPAARKGEGLRGVGPASQKGRGFGGGGPGSPKGAERRGGEGPWGVAGATPQAFRLS